MRASLVLLLVGVLSGLPAPAVARDVPVATVAELRAAVAAALPGDVIALAAGDYPVTGDIRCDRPGAPDAPITVRSECPGAARVLFDALQGFHVLAPDWTFEGLEVVGACAVDSDCEHAFHVVGAADRFTLRDCTVRDFNAQIKSNGQDTGGGWEWPDDVLIERCRFFDTRPRQTSNPVTKIDVVGGRRWIVRDNFLHDFEKAQGNQISYAAFLKGNSRDGLFEGNTVVCSLAFAGGVRLGLSFGGGGSSPDFICEDGTCTPEHQRGRMLNNRIASCNDVGIYLNECADCEVHHQTLHDTAGIDVRFAASVVDLRNNLMTGRIRDRDGGTSTRADNFELVPLADFQAWFRDPATGDFTLDDPSAPFLDAVPALAGVPTDSCGAPRDPPLTDAGADDHDAGAACARTPPQPAGPSPPAGPGTSLRVRRTGATDVDLEWSAGGDVAWNAYRASDPSLVRGLGPTRAWQVGLTLAQATDPAAAGDGAFHAYLVRAVEPCAGLESQ